MGEPNGWQVPSPARVYAYWLGDKDHFAADRTAADEIATAAPWIVVGARANRAWLRATVRRLTQQGVHQFLDLGCGLPTETGNIHDVAQVINPDARVVYVDNDPVVLAHARALMTPDDRVLVEEGDIRDPHGILDSQPVRQHLDLDRPVAVLAGAVLHFLTDRDDPAGVIDAFADRVCPGSPMVISHLCVDDGDERAETTRAVVATRRHATAMVRSTSDVARLFGRFLLQPPGLVHPKWSGRTSTLVAGIGCLSPRV